MRHKIWVEQHDKGVAEQSLSSDRGTRKKTFTYSFTVGLNSTTLKNTRQQLSLFLTGKAKETIEHIRRTYNPEQYALIGAHITLCREDELIDLSEVRTKLSASNLGKITVYLSSIQRFAEGKGLFLPSQGENAAFARARKLALRGIIENPRNHQAHLTLMHPRNSSCNDAIFTQISQLSLPTEYSFEYVHLIEQEGTSKWKILERFKL